jgi:hypothetical protein
MSEWLGRSPNRGITYEIKMTMKNIKKIRRKHNESVIGEQRWLYSSKTE